MQNFKVFIFVHILKTKTFLCKTNPISNLQSKIAVFPDSSGLAFLFSFRAFSFSCFEFVSDLDISASCPSWLPSSFLPFPFLLFTFLCVLCALCGRPKSIKNAMFLAESIFPQIYSYSCLHNHLRPSHPPKTPEFSIK